MEPALHRVDAAPEDAAFRDVRNGASFYDELLTVRPPTRFMGGIQVRF